MSVADEFQEMMGGYEKKIAFLEDAKKRTAAHYDEMISLPHAISSSTRAEWRQQADIANQMFDKIIDDLARLRGLEY